MVYILAYQEAAATCIEGGCAQGTHAVHGAAYSRSATPLRKAGLGSGRSTRIYITDSTIYKKYKTRLVQ